ncbi:hypothetical protein ABFS82_14G308100 [Erythranthe guttata]
MANPFASTFKALSKIVASNRPSVNPASNRPSVNPPPPMGFVHRVPSCTRPFYGPSATAGDGRVIEINSIGKWREYFKKGVKSNKLVVVEFMKPWCKVCLSIAPELAKIAKKRNDVIFLQIYAHDLKFLAREYFVEDVPTFFFLKQGKVVGRYVGNLIDDVETRINQDGDGTGRGCWM